MKRAAEGAASEPAFTSHRPNWRPRPLHSGLQLSSAAPLEVAQRSPCPSCKRSNAFYCCECLLPLTPGVPVVSLPFNLFVVTHVQQNKSSATGVHLALLAPLHAKLCSVDDLPSLDARTAAVLYPDDAAIPAEDVDVGSITDVVVVDSKWGQSRGILASDKLRNLRHIRLGTYVTSYWRYHTAGVPADGLCTVEAVYFMCRELHSKVHGAGGSTTDCHCFDNLLWYFAFQKKMVEQASAARRTKQAAGLPAADG